MTPNQIDPYALDAFTRAYLAAALWSSIDEEQEPLDANYDYGDCSQSLLQVAVADCTKFQQDHQEDIRHDPSLAGHDFWLTRNRHGSGFWDGGWDEDVGERLTEACRAYKEVDLYVGDDGKIYHQ